MQFNFNCPIFSPGKNDKNLLSQGDPSHDAATQSSAFKPSFCPPFVEVVKRTTCRNAERQTLKSAQLMASNGSANTAKIRPSKPSSSSCASAGSGDDMIAESAPNDACSDSSGTATIPLSLVGVLPTAGTKAVVVSSRFSCHISATAAAATMTDAKGDRWRAMLVRIRVV